MAKEFKLCPRCGEKLYTDLDKCYSCGQDLSSAQPIDPGDNPVHIKLPKEKMRFSCCGVITALVFLSIIIYICLVISSGGVWLLGGLFDNLFNSSWP